MTDEAVGPVNGAETATCPKGHESDAAAEFCSVCGSALWVTCPAEHRTLAANRFCETCGQPLPGRSWRRWALVPAAAVVVGLVAAGGLWAFSGGDDDAVETVASAPDPTEVQGEEHDETTSTTNESEASGAGEVVLGAFGLGVADIGDNGDAAIAAVTEVLGEPDSNEPGEYDPCVGGTVSFARWGELTLVVVVADLPRFVGYGYGTVEQVPAVPGDLATPEGITVGSTEDALRGAYPDVTVAFDEFIGATTFRVGETDDYARGLRGELVASGGTDVVAYIAAGQTGYCD